MTVPMFLGDGLLQTSSPSSMAYALWLIRTAEIDNRYRLPGRSRASYVIV